ncbi:MAG: hypothetical protein M3512_15565, partial [Bacteroidota bacterium]|nr:hypothetical protein [Bacteroidota bacterium]
MKLFKSFVFLICVCIVPTYADEVIERQFDSQRIEAYKELGEFNYAHDYSSSESFMSSIFNFLASRLATILGNIGISSFPPIILKLLLLFGIIFAALVILRLKYGKALTNTPKSYSGFPTQFATGENVDYQKLLADSLRDNHLKLAIRYLFFCSLE